MPFADADREVRTFVVAARELCAFVETAAQTTSVRERMHMAHRLLTQLVAAGEALPLSDPTSDRNVEWDGTAPDWPGFHFDYHWRKHAVDALRALENPSAFQLDDSLQE